MLSPIGPSIANASRSTITRPGRGCAEYYTLLGFGPSIVPHIMLQYAYDFKVASKVVPRPLHGIGGGVLFWYELLHELVFGRKTGMMTVVFPDMYKWWETWFEGTPGGGDEVAA